MAGARFSFRLTRGGWALLLVCILLTLGAINTELNMVYLLASLLLAILATAIVAPIWSVRGLVCRRAIREATFAGEPIEIHFQLYSARRTSARMVRIEDPLGARSGRAARTLAWRIAPHGQARLSCVAPGRKRGVYPLPALRWSSGFPFGLAQCALEETPKGELVVYPARGRLSAAAAAALQQRDAYAEARSQFGIARDEFRSVREYRPGDSLRRIHWRASAHLGRLCVCEMERERAVSVLLLLDARIPASLAGRERQQAAAALELAISYAAELCRLALQTGRSVDVIGFFPEPRLVRVGAPEGGGLFALLEALARLTPSDAETAEGLLQVVGEARAAAVKHLVAVTPVPETAATLADAFSWLDVKPVVASSPGFADTFRLLRAIEEDAG